jgi:hypothetical protein
MNQKKLHEQQGLTSRQVPVHGMPVGGSGLARTPKGQVKLDQRAQSTPSSLPRHLNFCQAPIGRKTMKSLKEILDTLRNQTITPELYKNSFPQSEKHNTNSFPQLFITSPEYPSYDDLSMSDKLSLYLELSAGFKTFNNVRLSTIQTMKPEPIQRTRNLDVLAQAIAITTPLVYKYFLGEIKFRKSFEHSDGHHIKRGEKGVWLESAAINDLPPELQEGYKNLINSGSMLIVYQHNLLAMAKEYLNLKKIKDLT